MSDHTSPATGSRVQLHLVLPYKADPAQHNQIRAYLDRGYQIEQFSGSRTARRSSRWAYPLRLRKAAISAIRRSK